MLDYLRNIDHSVYRAINNLTGKVSVLDSIAVFLAGNVFVAIWFGFLAGLWLKFKELRANVQLALASALISRLIVVEALKRIIDRVRPYEALSNVHKLIVDNEHGISFPSGHAVIFFSIAFAFWGTKYFWPFLILAALASIVRVYVGVHYPADVLASVLIAALTVWTIGKFWKQKQT